MRPPYSNSWRPLGPYKRRTKNIEESKSESKTKPRPSRVNPKRSQGRAEARAEQELLQDCLMAKIEASRIAMEEHVQTNEELHKTNEELRKDMHDLQICRREMTPSHSRKKSWMSPCHLIISHLKFPFSQE